MLFVKFCSIPRQVLRDASKDVIRPATLVYIVEVCLAQDLDIKRATKGDFRDR